LAQDSSKPDFWDTRYRGGVTPWDAGGVPRALENWVNGLGGPRRVLIPGAGTGYEARLFSSLGHEVLAIDFSDAAIEAARRELGLLAHLVVKADFFSFAAEPFDLVYERAFLCALPRREWPRWGTRMGELVRAGGRLAGFFYIDDNERGPPFGISRPRLDQLLSGDFSMEEDQPIPPGQSLTVFQGKERWQVWRRKKL
jgi:SAM-dependent methyltransferase